MVDEPSQVASPPPGTCLLMCVRMLCGMVVLSRARLWFYVWLPFLAAACGGSRVDGWAALPSVDPTEDNSSSMWGLKNRHPNPTCHAFPPPATLARARDAFVGLPALSEPIAMARLSSANAWYVIERGGRVLRFQDSADAVNMDVVLDISDVVDTRGDGGLVGLALHPLFNENGFLYLSFATMGSAGPVGRVARFSSSDGGATFSPEPTVLIELAQPQPLRIHLNADLHFGPDGMLYAAFGDGAPQGDPEYNAQNPSTFAGKIVRLNVDGCGACEPAEAEAYTVTPEVYASGLRNPWRFSFDRLTGEMWLGDVGWGASEEIDRVKAGDNFGWPLFEGTACLRGPVCDQADYVPPVAQYGHSLGGASITGGYVYHGRQFPELLGRYVFADFVHGDVWALGADGSQDLIAKTAKRIVSFAEDNDGELLAVNFAGGLLLRLERDAPSDGVVPNLLSDTGCFSPEDPNVPAPALVPYEVIHPFWSDGAWKRRFIALPDGQTAHARQDGSYDIPVGAVLVKEFFLGEKKVETRLLMKFRPTDWVGYSYAWDEDGGNARLVPEGGYAGASWNFPSRSACLGCHNTDAPLAFHSAQLARSVGYALTGPAADQLTTLEGIGLIDGAGASGLPTEDQDNDLESRARTYLHVNCGFCHVREGPTPVDMDLSLTTPLADARLCAVLPQVGDLGVAGALRLSPGHPEKSILSLRMRALGNEHMPPLGPASIDEEGATLIDRWIESLTTCPME